MGKDALIVSPEGFIGSCWQLSENQQAMGLDLHFGSVSRGKMVIDEAALEKQRERSEENRESCKACFCYAHCAGGCMLNQKRNKDFCRMTRIITLWQLLEQLGCFTQANEMLGNSDFQDWLAERTDFLDVSGVISDVSHINFSPRSDPDSPEVSEVRPKIDAVSRQRSSMDVIRGWLRNGTRIITADIDKELVNVLEGEDALRFQLEHSGMTESDIESVYTALHEERN